MTGSLDYWTRRELKSDERKLIQDVEEHDCHVLLVSGGDVADWAYSVGLYERFSHPEVVLFGLPGDVAQWIINELTSRIRAGERFVPGASVLGLLEGDFVVVTRNVETCWYDSLFGYAIWFYRGRSFPVMQFVWPDKQGRYPWESAFNPAWFYAQPLLDSTDAEQARMEPFLRVPTQGCSCGKVVADWTFSADPHSRAITQRHIATCDAPILLVAHDQGDGGWQFLDGSEAPENLAVSCLHHLIELDPSVKELADLPVGWQAWRSEPGGPWRRAPYPEEEA